MRGSSGHKSFSSFEVKTAAYQDALHVIWCGRCLAHEHFLGNIFPPLCLVQFVVGVTIQSGPAKELG